MARCDGICREGQLSKGGGRLTETYQTVWTKDVAERNGEKLGRFLAVGTAIGRNPLCTVPPRRRSQQEH